ncbi:MAG TPA: hypothetical protein VFK06_15250 [Candidatus Angelobacter sp.]|nr:hypothetical protein [Candidatus Angelobacter sp.]
MKKELRQRIEIYSKLTEDERKKHGYPFFPDELQNSLVQQVWQKYIRLPLTGFKPNNEKGAQGHR